MAEIFGSAVASESVSRIFSILSPGNKSEHESAEDNAERLEFAVLKIHSVVAISEDWLILHQPLISWRSRLKRVAKEGDEILRAHRRRSTEERSQSEGAAARQSTSVRNRITRAATRFLPFRRGKEEDDPSPSEATVRRFERLATIADEFFRYVQLGGRPRTLKMVSLRVPMEPMLAGKTLEFSLRMGSRDAILVLHPCDGGEGEAGGPREIAMFLSYDDTAVWVKNVKLFVVFQLLENIDVLDMVMSALQLLPPQFGAACVTTRELVREVLPTLETSYSSASSVSMRCISTAWKCHRNSMDRGCDAASSGRPRLPLPIIRVDAVYFTDTMPQKDSSDMPATAGGLPLRLACHITPHLMPQRYSEHYEQIGQETLQELELLPQGTPTSACTGIRVVSGYIDVSVSGTRAFGATTEVGAVVPHRELLYSGFIAVVAGSNVEKWIWRELIRGWMIRRAVVPLVHQSSNSRFDALVSHKGGIFFQWEATFQSIARRLR
uniref:Uncharacterized protein n=1 Tax=Avena sativa TaxID=4498 RepID=A0ACD5Y4I5_AVESA